MVFRSVGLVAISSAHLMRLHRQGTLERVAPGCIEAAAARVWLGDPETTCAIFLHPPTTKRMEWAKKKVGTYPMQETQSNKETQMSFINISAIMTFASIT